MLQLSCPNQVESFGLHDMMADTLASTCACMKTLTVLGSTGSIGTNTLDVVRRSRHQYQVYALVAGYNVDTLAAQIAEFRPCVAVVATSDVLARLSDRLLAEGLPRSAWPELAFGNAARVQVATAPEVRSEERRVGKECRSRWSPDH